MKKLIFLLIVILLFVTIPNIVIAHPGRTDGAGGHCNYSTGYYHYHTGEHKGESYPSEKCGYNFSDNRENGGNNTVNYENEDDYDFFSDTLPVILGLCIFGWVIFFLSDQIKKMKDKNGKE